MIQGDLFGKSQPTPRGWTELDKLRRRYAILEKRIINGEYDEKDVEEFHRIGETIIEREKEARGKWTQSFGS
jgi:hypothetical protein